MAEHGSGPNQRTPSRGRIRRMLGGLCIILFPVVVIAVAVLWRASWYYE